MILTDQQRTIRKALLANQRHLWLDDQDADEMAIDVDHALSSAGAFDAHVRADLAYEAKVRAETVRDVFAWLAERTNELRTARLETDEDKGVNITTDLEVERWLDEMLTVYDKEEA